VGELEERLARLEMTVLGTSGAEPSVFDLGPEEERSPFYLEAGGPE